MFSAITNGLSGMLANQRALDTATGNIASMGAGAGVGQLGASPSTVVSLSPEAMDYAREAVNSISARHGFEMSADVVKTADQMLGTLLDMKR